MKSETIAPRVNRKACTVLHNARMDNILPTSENIKATVVLNCVITRMVYWTSEKENNQCLILK